MEDEKPRIDMNWSITWKVLAANFVIVTIVVIALQKMLWPAEEWECRNNIMMLNRACAAYNRAHPDAMLVEDLTEQDPKTKKSYIEQVLVPAGLVTAADGARIVRTHVNERKETEEIHYYYLGEVAHSWDLYYTGLRVTRQLPDGPKTMNVACKCNAHEMNPETIELLGILILTGIVSISTWSFMGYSLPFKDEEDTPPAETAKT